MGNVKLPHTTTLNVNINYIYLACPFFLGNTLAQKSIFKLMYLGFIAWFFPACLRGEIYHWPWEDVGHLKVTAVDVILNDLVMKSICFLFSWNGSTSLITSSKPVWKSVVKPLLGSFKIGNRWIAKCINFWLHVKIWHTFTHSQILLLFDPYWIHVHIHAV